ncbi:MAG TPA: excinuclease ABC subunit UvrC [Solirubrobacterales bacterium]|nr:excinuclease ABC subunit UvrC [Solirubrobacterales bacterium]
MAASDLDRLTEQRRALPDAPGVYLFRDAEGRVLYVGKANSIRKRVGSHFSGKTARGSLEFLSKVDSFDFIVTQNEAEALLAEQRFIKQHRPPFNIRLRDDKSYPYVGISLEERFPRVYFTRERHRAERAYFGPFSSAKRVRETLDLLGQLFPYRTCDGPEPGRSSGSPCLDYYIKRCQAPCVDYVTEEEYRANIEAIISFLSGRYRQIERELEQQMSAAAEAQEFEQAAVFRNRLRAVRSLFQRQRIASGTVGTLDVLAVAVEDTEANAQVFQVRDGVLADRQSFYLENRAGRSEDEVAEEFAIQYYATSLSIPGEIVGPASLAEAAVVKQALEERREAPVEIRHARRGEKRRLYELAERNARLAIEQDKLKTERRRQQRVDALNDLREALGMDALPVRIEGYDISNLGPEHTVASMVVFEGGAPRKSDYRRFKIRKLAGRQDDFAAMQEVLTRRMARWVEQRDLSPHDPERDRSFAALPALIVIDGGKGQLSSGVAALDEFVEAGVVVVSLAKRLEEIYVPGRGQPIVLPRDSRALQLLQRIRDEAHRFAGEHHRLRRTQSMKKSVLDELPGVGPVRKRTLLLHFGSPERFLGATREELEAVPGLPGKVARQIHEQLNKTG